ncbi:MAG: phenylalanine--tRNA ligase subunit beta [Clostridia bacterium]
MKVTYNWLKEFVDIDVTPVELADKLVKAGFEIEEIVDLSQNMQNVVVGKIEKLEKHPDADKLQICQINVGLSENIQIVTGASNVNVGDLVPVALDNSILPNGMKIKKGKLRGVASNGMLCSGEELKLTEQDYKGASIYGIMILHEDYKLGEDINKIFGNDDVILDVGVTANRPDCNSILGIAREVATVLNKPLKMPKLTFNECKNDDISNYISVDVQNIENCPRYMSKAVKDIKIAPSPKYMQKRLKALGLRPINNIVDITNYVLLEIGQPMHAFDKNFLEGGKIVVRNANANETITTLDEKVNKLDTTMLVVCDENKPCALAGIMGGLNSGINANTNTVIFESARFNRQNIRRTSRKLNIKSDSSFRFERGIDFDSQQLGLFRALSLIDETKAGTIVGGLVDICASNLQERTVTTTTSKINAILGIKIDDDIIAQLLNSLHIKTTIKGDKVSCIVPLYREDIENANDLAEEIIRLYGYDNIKSTLLQNCQQTRGGKSQNLKNLDIIRDIAVNAGMSETLTYSFTTPKMFDILNIDKTSELRNVITLLNPLGEDLSIMRTTLAYNMIQTMANNILNSNKEARFFEISKVYLPKGEDIEENNHFVLGVYGKNESFYTAKGVIENILYKFGINARFEAGNTSFLHNGRNADIVVNGFKIGYVGEVHPNITTKFDVKERIYIAELDIEKLSELANFTYSFEAVPKFPPMERDLAVIVDENINVQQIIDIAVKAGGNLLKNIEIFDIFRGDLIPKDKKSVAFNMIFRLVDRTLTEEEVSAKINKILKNLENELGAKLR